MDKTLKLLLIVKTVEQTVYRKGWEIFREFEGTNCYEISGATFNWEWANAAFQLD